MPEESTQQNFNTQQASDYLGSLGVPFTPGTMEVWRSQGKGPEFKRVLRRIFYLKSSLDRFAAGEVVHTTDSLDR